MRGRFQTIQVVGGFSGSLLLAFGGILLLPLIIAAAAGELEGSHITLFAFLLPALLSLGLGFAFQRLFPRHQAHNTVQSMLICGLGWIFCAALGALPFVIGLSANFLDGFFEAMSGFTTTGITVFSHLDGMPKSLLFWRALTQWLGGLGILTFFLAVSFKPGTAYRLFGAESHKIEVDRPVPGLSHTLKILWGIYIIFTTAIALSLYLAGIGPFESLCHAFTTLSTGGFSTHDSSIAYYQLHNFHHYIAIEYILILGMVLGGTNFFIHYRLLKGDGRALFDNTEMRYWWSLIAGFVLLVFIERIVREGILSSGVRSLEGNFRAVVFQVTAIITTTGFSTRDIAGPFFGPAARQLFLLMMVIGGCVGSTGGGFKVLRAAILTKTVRREIFRLRSPLRSISNIVIDGKIIKVDEVRRAGALFFAWAALLAVGGIITAFFSRLDGYQSFSGIFSALGNVGPSYIPTAEIGGLHPIIKLTYIIGMLAGRLEIIPVLLLFSPKSWR